MLLFQLCGSFPDTMARCTEMLNNEVEIDFIDVNIGCPIDLVYKKVFFLNFSCYLIRLYVCNVDIL